MIDAQKRIVQTLSRVVAWARIYATGHSDAKAALVLTEEEKKGVWVTAIPDPGNICRSVL